MVKENKIESGKETESSSLVKLPNSVVNVMLDESYGNFEASELLLPRVEIAQSTSEQIDKSNPERIEGLEQGQLFNNITQENYGEELEFIPVYYVKAFFVWLDRESNPNGFRGVYGTPEEAQKGIDALDPKESEIAGIVETPQLFGFVRGKEIMEIASISFPRTKTKIIKKFLSTSAMINRGRGIFSHVVKVGTRVHQNSKNQKYHNFTLKIGSPIPDGELRDFLVNQSAKINEMYKSGLVKVDMSNSGGDISGDISEDF